MVFILVHCWFSDSKLETLGVFSAFLAMELYLGTSVASNTPLVRAGVHVGSPSVAKGKVQDISATLLGERFGGWMNIWTLTSLKLTAILHLKMDGWNTFSFPFQMAYFQV